MVFMRGKTLISLIVVAFLVVLWLPNSALAEEKQKTAGDKTVTTEKPTKDAAAKGGPDLFYPETTFDFGDVGQSATVTHIFKVMNKGDATLKITKVRAS